MAMIIRRARERSASRRRVSAASEPAMKAGISAGSSFPKRSASWAAPAMSAGEVARYRSWPPARFAPFGDHRLERGAYPDQRCVLLDDANRGRYHAQERLVHRTHPYGAFGLFGSQKPSRDELVDKGRAILIAPFESGAVDGDDRERLQPAVDIDRDVAHEGGDQVRERGGVPRR